MQTIKYGLKKPEVGDIADLEVFVGDNMDIIANTFDTLPQGGGGVSGVGERLVKRVTHNLNPEYHIQSIDWNTCIATLTEPHGLSEKTEILIAPNYVGLDAPLRDLASIPIEWTDVNTNLALLPIDETTVKVIRKDNDLITPVDITVIENLNNTDHTLFHFEKCVPVVVGDIPTLKKLRYRHYGYIRYRAQYRYTQFKYLDNTDTENLFSYIQMLGIPTIISTRAGHSIFAMEDWVIDVTQPTMIHTVDSHHTCRRYNYANVKGTTREEFKRLYYVGKEVKGITEILTYALDSHYSYMANGTVIEIYDMVGGTEVTPSGIQSSEITKIEIVTQAEYDALTEEEKTNVLYHITG